MHRSQKYKSHLPCGTIPENIYYRPLTDNVPEYVMVTTEDKHTSKVSPLPLEENSIVVDVDMALKYENVLKVAESGSNVECNFRKDGVPYMTIYACPVYHKHVDGPVGILIAVEYMDVVSVDVEPEVIDHPRSVPWPSIKEVITTV